MVVSGQVTPDNILLDKVMLTVVAEHVGDKHAELVPDASTGSLVEREVEPGRRAVRCLTDDELLAVATLAKRAKKHYGCPQDIEWALDTTCPREEPPAPAVPPGNGALRRPARPGRCGHPKSRARPASP
ncbi:hypothetical protein SHIRM173S_12442 [Streptomyces hirsutus]